MDSSGAHRPCCPASGVALVLYQGECEVLARSSCSEVIRDRTMLYANIGHLMQGVIGPLSAHDATTAEEVIRERKVLLPADPSSVKSGEDLGERVILIHESGHWSGLTGRNLSASLLRSSDVFNVTPCLFASCTLI